MVKKVATINTPAPQSKDENLQINSSTQIVFTVKTFVGTIITILGIFYGFYQLVVVPKINDTEEHYKLMFEDQKKQNTIFYDKLGNINSSIGALNATIESLNKEKNIERHSTAQSPIQSTNDNSTGGSIGGLTMISNH